MTPLKKEKDAIRKACASVRDSIPTDEKSLLDAKIIVDASACAGVTPESHKNALEAMKMCQILVINE